MYKRQAKERYHIEELEARVLLSADGVVDPSNEAYVDKEQSPDVLSSEVVLLDQHDHDSLIDPSLMEENSTEGLLEGLDPLELEDLYQGHADPDQAETEPSGTESNVEDSAAVLNGSHAVTLDQISTEHHAHDKACLLYTSPSPRD